jgi:limonene-1,2-epoxide hydrolase
MDKWITMKLLTFSFWLTLILATGHAFAENDVYNFDTIQTLMPASAFENEARIHPKPSDFSIVRAIPMSTQNGDRAALVVIKNMASGQRILDSKHIVAIIADGTRVFGNLTDAKVKLAGQEQITIKLEFGTFDYPIVSLYTSQSET